MTEDHSPAPGAPAHTTGDGWQVLTATQRGVAHDAVGLPNQDAVAVRWLGGQGVVVAVADGHGHWRHFRSDRGSRLAVAAACDEIAQRTAWLAGLTDVQQARDQVHEVLVPAILARWREAVRADVKADPLTAEEEVRQPPGDDITIAYGTTLLVAVVWESRLVLAQVGDGDIIGIRVSGAPLLAVPADPLLDGRYTTSMCSPGAAQAFRAAAVDLSATPLLGVVLATDGYANAQAAEGWQAAVTACLAEVITEYPTPWLVEQLPQWASRCASAEGSADDTTIALLLAPQAEPGE
ncbi:MAG TPA: protein phosphatase 2C domain-containing protein [Streptosporangiaceae bacterium]|nr:protein phosphatase 2C domain-containing protein [Streptosporangiaceae bacterium]